MKKNNKKNLLQAQTLQIMEDSGLQIDYRGYSDPIYKSQMMGNFLRKIYHDENKALKMSVGLFLLLFPLFTLGLVSLQTSFSSTSEIILDGILFIIVFTPVIAVGLKLLLSATMKVQK